MLVLVFTAGVAVGSILGSWLTARGARRRFAERTRLTAAIGHDRAHRVGLPGGGR